MKISEIHHVGLFQQILLLHTSGQGGLIVWNSLLWNRLALTLTL